MARARPARAAARGGAGLLLDTNLFVLLVVGEYDLAWIPRCKRTAHFDDEDFALLRGVVAGAGPLLTTPNVATEVSNLLGQLPDRVRPEVMAKWAEILALFRELYVPSHVVAPHPHLARFGVTDLALGHAAGTTHVVLTDDARLAAYLGGTGTKVIDFRELRRSAT